MLLDNGVISSDPEHEVNFCSSFNWSFIGFASNELYFCCRNFLTPQSSIKEALVINNQDSAKDKLFHLNEPLQLIISKECREKILRE